MMTFTEAADAMEEFANRPGWEPLREDLANKTHITFRHFEYRGYREARLWVEMREHGRDVFMFQGHVSLPYSAGPEMSTSSERKLFKVRPSILAYEKILSVPLKLAEAFDANEIQEALKMLQAPPDSDDDERYVYRRAHYLMTCVFDMGEPSGPSEVEDMLKRTCTSL